MAIEHPLPDQVSDSLRNRKITELIDLVNILEAKISSLENKIQTLENTTLRT
jgi:hypothetical protein